MKHLDLFSGIGGFAIAAHQAQWETVGFCENDPFCNHLLKHYWPNANFHSDIKTTDFSMYRGKVDIITGGFPCQPYSSAGKRMGKNDDRHLWPEMLRAIREIKPRWIVGENVSGLLTWSGGLVFEEVCADLENEGYEVQAYLIPACAVDAPHIRERVWIVAYAAGFGCDGGQDNERQEPAGRERSERGIPSGATSNQLCRRWEGVTPENRKTESEQSWIMERGFKRFCISEFTPNTNHISGAADKISTGREKPDVCATSPNANGNGYQKWNNAQIRKDYAERGAGLDDQPERHNASDALGVGIQRGGATGQRQSQSALEAILSGCNDSGSSWKNFPTQSPICSRNDGVPSRMVQFTVSGRRGRRTLSDYQTRQRHRRESIKGAGNAIVPQVTLQIFRAINEFEAEIFSNSK